MEGVFLKMIFVMTGTQNNSFKRLIEEVEKIDTTEKIVAQVGYTKISSDKIDIFDFMSGENIEEYIKKADLIITHAGVGSIITSLNQNKKVIAVARRKEYGEHVNNHQIEITKIFNEKGYLIGIDDASKLQEAYNKIKNFIPVKYELDNSLMINTIEKFIESI